ncbi:MAG: protocatechuate 3,4-dioxygenase [Pseudomonadota bacterium]
MSGAATALAMAQPLVSFSAAAAKQLQPTPKQTTGPFYPTQWTGDIDNDLVVVTGVDTQAMGKVLHIQGQVLDVSGARIPNTIVEIWQVDNNGVYLHPEDNRGSRRVERGFQGRGRTQTDRDGKYSFRTIRPVAYPGRTPHIHFLVKTPGGKTLTTQLYFKGEAKNKTDWLFRNAGNAEARARLTIDPQPYDQVEAGAQIGNFDIILA